MPRCIDCANYGGARDFFCHPAACSKCDPIYKNYTEKPRIVIQPEPSSKTALNVQEGGQHYKDKAIQPIVYIHANNLGFCEANVVKYVTRWKDKNGIKDLEKAKHYLELLIELESR